MTSAPAMKILWIARTCPWPPHDGEKLRVFHLLSALARTHEVTLVCRVMNEAQRAGLDVLRRLGVEVHGAFVPPPRHHAERLRWVLPFLFSREPVSLATVYFEPVAEALRAATADRRFDVVQVEHSSMTVYLDRVPLAGRPLRVLTMHNIDALRNERLIAHTPFGLRQLFLRLDQRRFRRWEPAAVARYDLVVTMSALDGELLRAAQPRLETVVIPNGVDCAGVAFVPPADDASSLVFVASMDSEANDDAAHFLLDEVLPRLRAADAPAHGVPGVAPRVCLVGRGPSPALRARADGRRVVVTGPVEDVLPWYREAAVAVVPLRSGGGTRLKILEAMAAGVPVVSTSVGAEGLDLVPGEHLLIADGAEPLAAAVQRLLDDPALRRTLAARARAHVERHHDWPLVAARQDEMYRTLAAAHRDAADGTGGAGGAGGADATSATTA